MIRLTIALTDEEFQALQTLAERDLRYAKEHLRFLIREAAKVLVEPKVARKANDHVHTLRR